MLASGSFHAGRHTDIGEFIPIRQRYCLLSCGTEGFAVIWKFERFFILIENDYPFALAIVPTAETGLLGCKVALVTIATSFP